MAGLFVAQIEGLPASIANGIVVPWRESELVRITAPCVGHAALGNNRTEVRVREHVYPGRGRGLLWRRRDDVLASIGRETAEPVVEKQIGRCRVR